MNDWSYVNVYERERDERDFKLWTFYELYEFFVNFNKEALTFQCKKCILYIEKGNWADTVAVSVECKINILPF